ncbi:DUF4199 domain-containing protein [Marinifilum caeruleilacunae]|uniref:DUF4199 domain-containing protein n=1 Tax=Marinifilum caeruleilacunae TaxID=2499076 RepID=A0ABX1WZ97_9BACT|nr:DUF4199 domain-containing protein [Marinifilum caeruleilacunae]NOU61190.1 DUF4199 domain-containing protein [Marinifilum caeruleilacunae]
MYYRSLFKHSFLFGSLVGAVLILASLTFYWKDVSIFNPTLLFINRALIMLGIYFGVRKYRDEVLFGVISYGRAFVAGVLMIAVASSFYALYIYVLTRYFDASILKETLDLVEKGMVQLGYEKDLIDVLMKFYRKITPEAFAFGQWFSKMMAGVFFSLIVAFFFRQKRNLFNNSPIDKFNGSKNQ